MGQPALAGPGDATRAFERMIEEHKRSQRQDPAGAIVGAARDLAAEGDFTVKQVADRAGMAVQTVYRHFGSKDELVLAVLEESLAAGCEYISEVTNGIKDPLDRLEQIIRISILAAKDSPQLRLHARERVRLVGGPRPRGRGSALALTDAPDRRPQPGGGLR